MNCMPRAFAILGLLCFNAVVSSARTLHAADTNVAVIQAADTEVDVGSDVGSWWGRRVEVLLAVMSRCPDGRRAEARINEVLAKVHSIADVRLMYIAAKNESAQPLGVTCKHGDLECAGNAQQLCAAYYGRHGHSSGTTGGDPWTRGWDFIMCQNKSPADIGTEELAERCLQEAGFTERRANLTRACWNGPEAGPILRKSAAEALRRKAYKSATIFIGGAYRCTHDDAQWYDCPGGSEVEDFVATICATYFRYTSMWPEEICGPEPPEVSPTA